MPKKTTIAALALLATDCTQWVPASAAGAAGERYVRVQRSNETKTLRWPSRGALRELEREGARLEIRRTDGVGTAVAALVITLGVGVMSALVAYSATQAPIAWGNVP